MSASTSNSEIAAELHAVLVENYCFTATLALVCYEFIITYEHEYKFLWKRKWTAATWLFIANRYMLLASTIPQDVPFSVWAYVFLQCSLVTVLFDMPLVISAIFSALRVFAILNRAYIMAALVLLLGLCPVIISVFQNTLNVYHFVDDTVLGATCYATSNASPSTMLSCKRTRSYPILGLTNIYVIAIVTTWIKTYHHVKQAASVGVNAGFGATLLQYGTLYFVVLFIADFMNVLNNLVPSVQSLNLATFVQTLPSIMISRFLINLRQVDSTESIEAPRFSQFSVPNFRVPTIPDIIGNLGEPLVDGSQALDDDEDDRMQSCEVCFHEPNLDPTDRIAVPTQQTNDCKMAETPGLSPWAFSRELA
ncbi:hypothetical protein NM688_g6811 [Phlebia brevispora]|uniref:Uncharacterized protein n=1 Tax=Phlebia brevispora TaxID=194682 RepID=A0ACC1SC66_9APHY|nr:hypothetical protein NM688_g6811 [Phlebia brevispora]